MNVSVCVQFARYLRLHLHNSDQAKEVISKALETNPKNVQLYLQMLDKKGRKVLNSQHLRPTPRMLGGMGRVLFCSSLVSISLIP